MKLFLVAFFSIYFLAAGNTQKDSTALLWKIEHPNSKNTSYLFGTIHIIEKQYFVFTDSLEKIVSSSDKLIMELEGVPNEINSMQLLILKEGTCFDNFSTLQMDTLTKWAKENLNMDSLAFVSTFSSFKPFILAQLSIPLYFKGKTESYEGSFQSIADSNQIERIGLETAEFQMGLFDGLSKENTTEMVMESIRNPKKSIEFYTLLQETYAKQSLTKLESLLIQEEGVIMEEQDAFLVDRNKNWIQKIIQQTSNNNCFIAVGAAHLIGEQGVLQLLLDKGYQLTPIKL